MNSPFRSAERDYLRDPFMSEEELAELEARRERAEWLEAQRDDEARESPWDA